MLARCRHVSSLKKTQSFVWQCPPNTMARSEQTLLQVTIPCVVLNCFEKCQNFKKNAKDNLHNLRMSHDRLRNQLLSMIKAKNSILNACLEKHCQGSNRCCLCEYLNVWSVIVTPFWWHFQHLLCHLRRQKLQLKKSKNDHCLEKQNNSADLFSKSIISIDKSV